MDAFVHEPVSSSSLAWFYVACCGLAGIVGACFIFLDVLILRWRLVKSFDLRHNKTAIVGVLGFGGGIMIYTAFVNILPEAGQYMISARNSRGVPILSGGTVELLKIAGFGLGAGFLFVFNESLHRFLPSKIVHCGEVEPAGRIDYVHPAEFDGRGPHRTDASDGYGLEPQIRSPLLSRGSQTRLRARPSLRNCQVASCAGYTSPCSSHKNHCRGHSLVSKRSLTTGESQLAGFDFWQSENNIANICCREERCDGENCRDNDVLSLEGDGPHHHHIEDKAMMRLAIQICVAMIHKFPEGFITYVTTQESPELGLVVVLSLFVHNIAEGFLIVYTLYMALESRLRAFTLAALIGGLSQPLGAFGGYLWVKASLRIHDSTLKVLYGFTFAVVAGILVLLSVESMLPQAFKNDNTNGSMPTIAIISGMLVMGITGAFAGNQ